MLLPLPTARKVVLPGIAAPLGGLDSRRNHARCSGQVEWNMSAGSKLHLDFAGRSRLRQDVDDDIADLIAQLCTRAGMIMEDMSVLTLTMGSIPEANRALALTNLEIAAAQITALIGAARAMQGRFLRSE